MEPSDKSIDAIPGKLLLEMLLDTTHFFFPDSQRERFESTADRFESMNQSEWLKILREKKAEMHDAFLDMRNSMNEVFSDKIVGSWSDEVLFFYILRIQYVYLRIAQAQDQWVPGRLPDFWDWGMGIRDDDPWMLFPVFTATEAPKVRTKTPIWRIPYPADCPR